MDIEAGREYSGALYQIADAWGAVYYVGRGGSCSAVFTSRSVRRCSQIWRVMRSKLFEEASIKESRQTLQSMCRWWRPVAGIVWGSSPSQSTRHCIFLILETLPFAPVNAIGFPRAAVGRIDVDLVFLKSPVDGAPSPMRMRRLRR